MSHDFSPLRDAAHRFWQSAEEKRAAEERDRREWIDGLKRRHGIVTIGEKPIYLDTVTRDYWPAGVPLGQYTAISDHRLEIPPGWPPECRCVLLDGEQVALGGPCPVHQPGQVSQA